MKNPQAGKKSAGFTLIELLVVITIIGVLGVMVFGIAKSAMNKAHLTSDLSNLSDFGKRVHLYADDHGSLLPVYHSDELNLYWWGMLVDDPKSESQLLIFKSPNDKKFDIKKVEETISYGWNAAVVGRSDTPSNSEDDDGQKRMSNFSQPGRVLVIADGSDPGRRGLLDATTIPDPKRYNGKIGGVFLDGAARIMEVEGDFRGKNKWFINPDKLGNQ